MKNLNRFLIFLSCFGLLACVSFSFVGCKNPAPFLYTPYTNVISETVTPVQTNTVTVWVTNPAPPLVVTNTLTGAVTITPMQSVFEDARTVVTYATQKVIEVGYTTNTNTAALLRETGTVINTVAPGVGTAVTAIGAALITLVGGFFRHKKVITQLTNEAEARVVDQKVTTDNVARALTFAVENYRDVILKLPNGEVIDTKLMSEAQKAQQGLNVGALVADIVKNHVHNPEIQAASASIASEARRLAGGS